MSTAFPIKQKTSKYRNSTNNLLAKMLFVEYDPERTNCFYTLKTVPYEGYPSLYQLYIAESDPTEYKFAKAHLEGWKHWEMLTSAEWFKPYIEDWRRELKIKLESEALEKIKVVADSGSKDSLTANKYLVDRFTDKPATRGRGRPNKLPDPAKVAKQLQLDDQQLEADFERIVGGVN